MKRFMQTMIFKKARWQILLKIIKYQKLVFHKTCMKTLRDRYNRDFFKLITEGFLGELS